MATKLESPHPRAVPTASVDTENVPTVAPGTMQAMVYHRYGPPGEVLALTEIAALAVAGDAVRVRVQAAALSIGDCFGVRGAPLGMRLATGLLKPTTGVPGYDLAGWVPAVGPNVTHFSPGDAVFGAGRGTCAEYVRVGQDTLAAKPAHLTFAEAAAVPTSALAALHALRDAGKVQPGQRVLINGAAGGVGTFAVQIARAFGAEVTGICSTRNLELVRSLGADHVIDYLQQDFTRGDERYDVIFDNVENRSLAECRRVLTPAGTLILNSGTGAHGLGGLIRLARPFVVAPFVRQRLCRFLSRPKHDGLVVLKELIEAGKLRPVVDRIYLLRETPAALGYIEGGHARGKVVVAVARG